ncbi:hypothetical protein FCT18_01850 [Lysinibacillus sphaericus]|uniref:Uncharacterized protein n=2 Tax=Lysinibacillus TaxID=400634 RepID=A0A2S0K1Z6_LYSSH|nr:MULTISPECIES: hypothetical protein [Lysinibacillus]AVK97392.1 hypothetical protein LS41612_14515 [Lysinibacillus sphaericus]MED4542701.1 hypothetical protein [Lysinibacillus sphaericus]TKI21157.1 hypothetical protein FCT18_01850 [Lysinibacillus sphaericus]TKI47770.1 hypothetical protein FC748_08955 [Lysinibacillus tabacifolii]SUV16710.1 Uncharacterised protein [Lysinibacillus sphaericus]
MKFYILGEKNERIEIEVLIRIYPNSTDYWDANWITSTIKIEIPGYLVQFTADLRTDELRDFLAELTMISSDLSGKAMLLNMEDYIQLECQMNKMGQLLWSGQTCYPVGNGAVLKFEFKSDQSYLQRLVKEVEDILLVFPVIGNPD